MRRLDQVPRKSQHPPFTEVLLWLSKRLILPYLYGLGPCSPYYVFVSLSMDIKFDHRDSGSWLLFFYIPRTRDPM